jgi:hypothetical protein
MHLLQVKMDGYLLEGGRLSNYADDFMRMVEEEAGSTAYTRTSLKWRQI